MEECKIKLLLFISHPCLNFFKENHHSTNSDFLRHAEGSQKTRYVTSVVGLHPQVKLLSRNTLCETCVRMQKNCCLGVVRCLGVHHAWRYLKSMWKMRSELD